MNRRNWARGDSPPAHSWEYVGLAMPPTQKQVDNSNKANATRAAAPAKGAQQRPVVMTATETLMIDIRPKQRIWPWALASGIVGFLWGRHRS